ncbi:MAG TPA: KUP/HAK/KT family potassium transporter [Rhodomicrobium sp.]|nr:KUP/HAK/KT family potassium transporter [Rhodomicrobium sp.]
MLDGSIASHLSHKAQSRQAALTVGAIGVVFGDIGTSPLYAVDQIFYGPAHIPLTPGNILGCISLVLWTLTLIVSCKYAAFVLRADSDGEGGVFALFSLLYKYREGSRFSPLLLAGLMLGAGFLFGDGIITPAISVLAAVEGLKVATPMLADAVIPITFVILALLFAVQRKGTAGVGRIFGPILILWFGVIAILGIAQIEQHPEILKAFNPVYAFTFLRQTGAKSVLLTLGALMLVVTGGEAMYADLGHFGARAIRVGWFTLVFPALMLNYLGQGALLLGEPPAEQSQLFYSMAPPALLYPMVALATVATVIASQALISGAFSLTSQAIALGLFPRLHVVHTHHHHEGQIYIPFVNWTLFAGCLALVLGFRSSDSLAAAYGLAVSGVMVITSIAMFPIGIHHWRWSAVASGALFGFFTLVNVLFCAASSFKFLEGGYIPLGVGLAVFAIMRTWRWGRKATFAAYAAKHTMTMRRLVDLHKRESAYMERIGLLMTPKHLSSLNDKAPALLQLLYDRYGILPRHLIFVQVAHRKAPYIHDGRYGITVFHKDHYSSIIAVTLQFGFMEEPNVEAALEDMARHREIDLPIDEHRWIVHVSVEHLLPSRNMTPWGRVRLRLFRILRRISQPAHYFYGLGDNVQLSAEIIPVRLK